MLFTIRNKAGVIPFGQAAGKRGGPLLAAPRLPSSSRRILCRDSALHKNF